MLTVLSILCRISKFISEKSHLQGYDVLKNIEKGPDRTVL